MPGDRVDSPLTQGEREFIESIGATSERLDPILLPTEAFSSPAVRIALRYDGEGREVSVEVEAGDLGEAVVPAFLDAFVQIATERSP